MAFTCSTLFILHVQSIRQTTEVMSRFILSHLSNLKRIDSVQLQLSILTHLVPVCSVIRLSVALNAHFSISYRRLRQDKIGVRRRQIENLTDCIKIVNTRLFIYKIMTIILPHDLRLSVRLRLAT